MSKNTISIKMLDTTRSIFEAKRAKTQRAKSILARIRDISTRQLNFFASLNKVLNFFITFVEF